MAEDKKAKDPQNKEDSNNENAPKLEELSQEQLIAKVKGLEEEKASLEELNKELNKALEESESKPSGKLPTFNVGKETYELVIPKTKFKGKEITAKVLKENADLVKELVDIKAGCLRLVEKGGDK